MPLTIMRRLKSRNALNWPGLIILDPTAPMRAAIWAQELYESKLRMNPVNALRSMFLASFRRKMELTGHEIEVQAAVRFYGSDEVNHRWREARALKSSYDEFRGMTVSEIVRQLRARKRAAQRFVNRHSEEIGRMVRSKGGRT